MKREIESVFFRCDRLFDGIATSEKNCVHVCAHTETVHEIAGPLNVLCAIHRAHQAEWFDFIEASIFIPYEKKTKLWRCFWVFWSMRTRNYWWACNFGHLKRVETRTNEDTFGHWFDDQWLNNRNLLVWTRFWHSVFGYNLFIPNIKLTIFAKNQSNRTSNINCQSSRLFSHNPMNIHRDVIINCCVAFDAPNRILIKFAQCGTNKNHKAKQKKAKATGTARIESTETHTQHTVKTDH